MENKSLKSIFKQKLGEQFVESNLTQYSKILERMAFIKELSKKEEYQNDMDYERYMFEKYDSELKEFARLRNKRLKENLTNSEQQTLDYLHVKLKDVEIKKGEKKDYFAGSYYQFGQYFAQNYFSDDRFMSLTEKYAAEYREYCQKIEDLQNKYYAPNEGSKKPKMSKVDARINAVFDIVSTGMDKKKFLEASMMVIKTASFMANPALFIGIQCAKKVLQTKPFKNLRDKMSKKFAALAKDSKVVKFVKDNPKTAALVSIGLAAGAMVLFNTDITDSFSNGLDALDGYNPSADEISNHITAKASLPIDHTAVGTELHLKAVDTAASNVPVETIAPDATVGLDSPERIMETFEQLNGKDIYLAQGETLESIESTARSMGYQGEDLNRFMNSFVELNKITDGTQFYENDMVKLPTLEQVKLASVEKLSFPNDIIVQADPTEAVNQTVDKVMPTTTPTPTPAEAVVSSPADVTTPTEAVAQISKTIVVEKGDTIWNYAVEMGYKGGDIQKFVNSCMEMNDITDATKLQIGENLKIPTLEQVNTASSKHLEHLIYSKADVATATLNPVSPAVETAKNIVIESKMQAMEAKVDAVNAAIENTNIQQIAANTVSPEVISSIKGLGVPVYSGMDTVSASNSLAERFMATGLIPEQHASEAKILIAKHFEYRLGEAAAEGLDYISVEDMMKNQEFLFQNDEFKMNEVLGIESKELAHASKAKFR